MVDLVTDCVKSLLFIYLFLVLRAHFWSAASSCAVFLTPFPGSEGGPLLGGHGQLRLPAGLPPPCAICSSLVPRSGTTSQRPAAPPSSSPSQRRCRGGGSRAASLPPQPFPPRPRPVPAPRRAGPGREGRRCRQDGGAGGARPAAARRPGAPGGAALRPRRPR